jgi:Gamma-glutamyltranspeptidase
MRQTLSHLFPRLFSSPFPYAVVAGLFLSGSLTAQQTLSPYSYSIPKKALVNHGAVVSAHPLASQVGVSILQQGGNAFDAAIATQLALAVVYPAAGNIGGGGFMVAHLAAPPHSPGKPAAKHSSATAGPNSREIALDFREKAPASATRDMYLDAAGNPVQGLSENGHLASGIPGTIAGLFAELKYSRQSTWRKMDSLSPPRRPGTSIAPRAPSKTTIPFNRFSLKPSIGKKAIRWYKKTSPKPCASSATKARKAFMKARPPG